MDQIRLVIADLQVVLALLAANPPAPGAITNDPRMKAALKQAADDLRTAAIAITGDDPGGGLNNG